MVQALANSPAGPIEPISGLKRRLLHRYWREINGEWVQTHPLPADPVSRDAYLARGFRMNNPKDEPQPKPDIDKEALYAEIRQLREENSSLKDKKAAKVATPA